MKGIESHFAKVEYASLNAKQKEVHNFHHIAAVLAKHGYATYPIRDDWNGGDMIARHMTDIAKEMLTIQIKGRLTFDRKYQNKKLWIGFPLHSTPLDDTIYIFPHDEVLARYQKSRVTKGQQPLEQTGAWQKDGQYSWDSPSKDLLDILEPYRLAPGSVGDHRMTPDHNAGGQAAGQSRLEKLAAFAPQLRNPPVVAAAPIAGKGTSADPYRLGGPPLSELETELSQMTYDAGWVIPEFNWSAWASTKEGRRLLQQPAALANATEEDLAKILTAIMRQERFAEGTIHGAIENGILLAAAERAQSLV